MCDMEIILTLSVRLRSSISVVYYTFKPRFKLDPLNDFQFVKKKIEYFLKTKHKVTDQQTCMAFWIFFLSVKKIILVDLGVNGRYNYQFFRISDLQFVSKGTSIQINCLNFIFKMDLLEETDTLTLLKSYF